MYTLPYGQDIFDIDVSPDGSILSAAVSDLAGNQALLTYRLEDLLNQKYDADTIFNFAVASPQSFRFSEDGRYLYGSSFYTGVSNIFRVDIATKDIAAMSNSITGLFRPTVIDTNRLFAFNFSSNGFQPVMIPNQQVPNVSNISFLGNITVEKHPELVNWQLPIASAAELDMKALTINEGKYKAGKEMKINYAIPIMVGYKNNFGIGYKMNISDPFNFRKLNFSISYTPREWINGLLGERDEDFVSLEDEELIHFSFEFETGKFTLNGGLNEAEFHDLFGPSQGSRKGARLGLHYDRSFIYDPPIVLDFRVGLSGFYGLDQSPEFQQILASGFNNNFFLNLSSSISFGSATGSLGAVDAEKGIQTSLWASAAMSAGKIYPRMIGTLDYGIQLPGKHLSLWLRTAAGSSFSDLFNPFTRFGFAAFGNNYIDYQATRRYRSPFSFPGLGYDVDRAIIAQRFAKGGAELVIPPLRFRKLGGFNFFVNWIQPTVFSSFLYTTGIDLPKNEFVNLGAQLDIRMVTFSLLSSTLSVGYAKAWDVNSTDRYDEWMVSLKLLH